MLITRFMGQLVIRNRINLQIRMQNSGRINILDQKERADENRFFSKQDDVLLKKILEASREGVTDGNDGIAYQASSVDEKIKLIFMKNGIPPSANPSLVNDLVEFFNSRC